MIRILVLYGSKGFYAVAMLGASSLIARHWGAAALGSYSVFLTLLTAAGVVAAFGADMRYIETAPRVLSVRRGQEEARLAIQTLVLVSLQCLVVLPLLYLILSVVVPELAPGAVALLPVVLVTTLGGILVSQERQLTNVALGQVSRPVILLAILIIAATGGLTLQRAVSLGIGASYSIVAMVGISLVVLRATNFLNPRSLLTGAWLRFSNPRSLLTGAWLRASGVYVLMALYNNLISQADRLIVLELLGSVTTGLYVAAQNILNVLKYGVAAVMALVLPLTARTLAGQISVVDFEAQAKKYSRIVFLFSVACVGLFVAAGDYILRLFAPGFDEAVVPLIILSAGVAAGLVFGFPITVLSLSSSRGSVVWAFALILVVSLATSVVLTVWMGLIGAALAAAASNLVSRAFLHYLCVKRTGISTAIF